MQPKELWKVFLAYPRSINQQDLKNRFPIPWKSLFFFFFVREVRPLKEEIRSFIKKNKQFVSLFGRGVVQL